MSTVLWLPSTGTAAVSPTPSGSDWAHNSGVSRPLLFDNAGASTLTDVHYAPDAGSHAVNANSLHAQFVSAVLPAQTIPAQIIEMSIAGGQDFTPIECFLTWKFYAVSTDGSTVIGTMVPVQRDSLELETVVQGRVNADAASTEVVCTTSFRLVLEVGIGGTPTAPGGRGHDGTMRFGEGAASAGLVFDISAANSPGILYLDQALRLT